MNINHLAIFYAVAEESSVSRGAERLCISQPAVSKQLAELERSLDVLLFDRTPRGVRLTEAGALLHGYARRLFALEADAERALNELKGLQRGRLALGASTTIGAYLLPERLTRFHQQYPGVEIQLQIANTETIQEALIAGTLDLGFTEGFVDDSELEAEVFYEDELVIIAPPTHPLLADVPVPLERIIAEPFVLREPGSGTRAVIERAFAERGLKLRSMLSLGATEAIKGAVASGAGLSIVSRLSIAAELEMGRLAMLTVKELKLSRPLHRLTHRDREPGYAVRAFLEALHACLAASHRLAK